MEKKGILETEKGFYCYIDQKYYVSLQSLVRRLRTLGTTSEEYYKKYLGEVGKCQNCGNLTKFKYITIGYRKFCSVVCSCTSDSRRKAVSQRFVGNPEKFLNSLEKTRHTNSLKSEKDKTKINEIRINTLHQRYGNDYFSQKAKRQWERRTQEDVDLMVAKAKATRIKNGTESYVQPYKNTNREIVIGGKFFKVQGYEDVALSLLAEIVDVNKIKTGREIPVIYLPTGKKYYPDIYFDNLLIEVKSEYTYRVDLEENLLKQSASIKSGYSHIFLVIHSKDLNSKRILKNKEKYLKMLHKAISSQASYEEGSTTIP